MALSPRIESFKKNHKVKHFWKEGYVEPVYISIWRSRIFTRVWKETEGEPTSVRKAKCVAAYLREVPIFIRDDEIIVGFYAEDPLALPVCIEAVDQSIVRKMIAQGHVKEDEIEEWEEILDYWKDRGVQKLLTARLTDEELKIASADHAFMEVLPTQYTSRSQAEYDLPLGKGLLGIKKILEEKYANLIEEREASVGGTEYLEINDKLNDLKAMMITIDAVIDWANRYADLAEQKAKEEKNEQRKKELLAIAERCRHVPQIRPGTLLKQCKASGSASLLYR